MSDEGVFTGGLPPMRCCGKQMVIEAPQFETTQWKKCETCGLIFHARKLWFFSPKSHVAIEWVHGPCLVDCSEDSKCSSKVCSTKKFEEAI